MRTRTYTSAGSRAWRTELTWHFVMSAASTASIGVRCGRCCSHRIVCTSRLTEHGCGWAASRRPNRMRQDFRARGSLLCRAGIVGQHPAEVVETYRDRRARLRIGEPQQRAEFRARGAAELVGRSGQMRATQLPEAVTFTTVRREDGVEVRALGWIHTILAGVGAGRIGDESLTGRVRVGLDARQIAFEGDAVVVAILAIPITEHRAAEPDRLRMHGAIQRDIGERTRPH